MQRRNETITIVSFTLTVPSQVILHQHFVRPEPFICHPERERRISSPADHYLQMGTWKLDVSS